MSSRSTFARSNGRPGEAPIPRLPARLSRRRRARGILRAPRQRGSPRRLRAAAEHRPCRPRLRDALRTAPCTIGGHHAYLGGLLEHTVAVATLAKETWDLHRRLDSDLLITAALLHDIGKTREFVYGAEITQSEGGAMLGHLELGAQMRPAGGGGPARRRASARRELRARRRWARSAPGCSLPPRRRCWRLALLDALVTQAHGALEDAAGTQCLLGGAEELDATSGGLEGLGDAPVTDETRDAVARASTSATWRTLAAGPSVSPPRMMMGCRLLLGSTSATGRQIRHTRRLESQT